MPLMPLPTDKWDSELSDIRHDMRDAPLNVHKLMAHNPSLLSAWWPFRCHSVAGGALSRDFGELVILRTAVQLRSWYEWASHVDRALKIGMEKERILKVLGGPDQFGSQSPEQLILTAVDEIFTCKKISSATEQNLMQHISVDGVLDLIAIHGMYVILGTMIRTWDLELDDGIAQRIAHVCTFQEFEEHMRALDATG